MRHEGVPDVDLEPLSAKHLAEVFALYSNSRVWTHLPSGRHTDPDRSMAVIDRAVTSAEVSGLGEWAVRDRATRRLAGTAGVNLADLDVWNLGYRFHPDFQGRGLAGSIGRIAIDAAHRTRSDVPVIARILATNPPSIRLAERLALSLAWHGAAVSTDGMTAPRRIYADRALTGELLERLIALG